MFDYARNAWGNNIEIGIDWSNQEYYEVVLKLDRMIDVVLRNGMTWFWETFRDICVAVIVRTIRCNNSKQLMRKSQSNMNTLEAWVLIYYYACNK